MPNMKVPGQAGTQGKIKRLKSLQPPQNPNIKRDNQWNFQWGDDHRQDDMKQMPKGTQEPRKMDANTIMQKVGQVFQPPNGKVTDYIRKFDSKNSSGAIKNHLDVLDKLMKKGNSQTASLTGMMGGGTMASIRASQQEQKDQCPPGQRFDTKQNKCVIDCPQGQIWDEAQQKCVIDPGNYNPNLVGGVVEFLIVQV